MVIYAGAIVLVMQKKRLELKQNLETKTNEEIENLVRDAEEKSKRYIKNSMIAASIGVSSLVLPEVINHQEYLKNYEVLAYCLPLGLCGIYFLFQSQKITYLNWTINFGNDLILRRKREEKLEE